jgi:hypothetical protein
MQPGQPRPYVCIPPCGCLALSLSRSPPVGPHERHGQREHPRDKRTASLHENHIRSKCPPRVHEQAHHVRRSVGLSRQAVLDFETGTRDAGRTSPRAEAFDVPAVRCQFRAQTFLDTGLLLHHMPIRLTRSKRAGRWQRMLLRCAGSARVCLPRPFGPPVVCIGEPIFQEPPS